MNGPLTMYKLKPIVHFPDPVELTPTMYGMKNIFSTIRTSSSPAVTTCGAQPSLPNIVEQVNKLLKVYCFFFRLFIGLLCS
jgi:hypothetical protein